MKILYANKQTGELASIEHGGVRVPFYPGMGPALFYQKDGKQQELTFKENQGAYTAEADGVVFSMHHEAKENAFSIQIHIKNTGETDFAPDRVGLRLGVDSYMVEYPQWNDAFFPSYFRCEKTHFTGYFMSPLGKLAAVVSKDPVAAWSLAYNTLGEEDDEHCHFGHRIYTGNLLLMAKGPLPGRHPQDLAVLKGGEEKQWTVDLLPMEGVADFRSCMATQYGLPMLEFDRYTLSKGERANLQVLCEESYEISVESPSGRITHEEDFVLEEYGVYTARVKTESGFLSEAKVYCRHALSYYLKAARQNAVMKPQKASTHTESWYGHFSAFLAGKHYPDKTLDALAKANFDEIMPHMFDFETGKPLIIPRRVQNMGCFVSLLVDLYETDREKNLSYLDLADRVAEEMIRRQGEDGAYRANGAHYTAVIYPAKSMMELAFCEKDLYPERYEKHMASAKRAVMDLLSLKEKIGTEGEHTLEDGMITCAALQLALYALTLKEEERAPFVEAAEYLMGLHRCLEELVAPDCRTRGGTLRFWEAQYDVMLRGNMLNTPHGWTSWKTYATYYLYLLTGKEAYLRDTIDTMGACLQMVNEDGDLRWAFIKDPYVTVKALVPDAKKPVKDGLKSVPSDLPPAYEGKYEVKTFGECYVDMISSWYRTGTQILTGGYRICPLIYDDGIVEVDNQGGACDNDVHEHFKCLEETLLKKAFVLNLEALVGYQCRVEKTEKGILVEPLEDCAFVHVNTKEPVEILINGKTYHAEKGMQLIALEA